MKVTDKYIENISVGKNTVKRAEKKIIKIQESSTLNCLANVFKILNHLKETEAGIFGVISAGKFTDGWLIL